jgi:murein DD-endopeptidase MepM/ murein hydrolase activator NlpD
MREGKTKKRSRRFSIMVVPHASDDANVFSFSTSYAAVFGAGLIALAAFLLAGLFTVLAVRENHQLQKDNASLVALNNEQTSEIRRLSAAAIAYNSTIETFAAQYKSIAKSYVSNGGGGTCTTQGSCASVGSVASDGAELQKALDDLRRADSSDRAAQTAKVEQSLSAFLNAIPTEWPVQGTVTSPFGARDDPVSGGASLHPGIDITAAYGSKVIAAGSGIVTFAGNKGDGYGNKVVIAHGHEISTLYAHLSAILVTKGEQVKEGALIGRVGSTGRSTGSHLHFEVRVGDTPVNPLAYLASTGK